MWMAASSNPATASLDETCDRQGHGCDRDPDLGSRMGAVIHDLQTRWNCRCGEMRVHPSHACCPGCGRTRADGVESAEHETSDTLSDALTSSEKDETSND